MVVTGPALGEVISLIPGLDVRQLQGDFTPRRVQPRPEVHPDPPEPGRCVNVGEQAGKIFVEGLPIDTHVVSRVRSSPLDPHQSMHSNKSPNHECSKRSKRKHDVNIHLHRPRAFEEEGGGGDRDMRVEQYAPTEATPVAGTSMGAKEIGPTDGRKVPEGTNVGVVAVNGEFAVVGGLGRTPLWPPQPPLPQTIHRQNVFCRIAVQIIATATEPVLESLSGKEAPQKHATANRTPTTGDIPQRAPRYDVPGCLHPPRHLSTTTPGPQKQSSGSIRGVSNDPTNCTLHTNSYRRPNPTLSCLSSAPYQRCANSN